MELLQEKIATMNLQLIEKDKQVQGNCVQILISYNIFWQKKNKF